MALPTLVVSLLVWPMLHGPANLGASDWPTHLWFVRHAGASLRQDGLPSLFVHYGEGVFYPHFAFYGGTLYALTGALSLVTGGHGRDAYVITWILAFAGAYGGWVWLGRMAGLGRWTAQAPAVLFVTSAYYLTIIYTKGDWPEFLASSAMPLLAASSISVALGELPRPLVLVALTFSAVVFTGGHTITLLYGTIFLVSVLLALMVGVPAARHQLTRRGVVRWLATVAPAVMANAWFLWPAVAYHDHTLIGKTAGDAAYYLQLSASWVAPGNVFALTRVLVGPGTGRFTLALPVLAMVWIGLTAGLAVAGRWGSGTWRPLLFVVAGVTGALIVVMMDVGIVRAWPAKLQVLQFSYRLEIFVLMGVAVAMLAALVLASRARHRLWTLLVVPILALSILGAARQAQRRPLGGVTHPYMQPLFATLRDFTDASIPELSPATLPVVTFPAERIRHDRVTVIAPVDPGQLVDTNLLSVKDLIDVRGAHVIGIVNDRSALDGALRHMVLQIDDDAEPGAARISVSEARTLPVVGGKIMSLLGVAGIAANLAVAAVGRFRRQRGD